MQLFYSIAILVLYLTRWLSFEENQATSVFHAFSMMCYAMPLLGAVIADGYLGRYRFENHLFIIYGIKRNKDTKPQAYSERRN